MKAIFKSLYRSTATYTIDWGDGKYWALVFKGGDAPSFAHGIRYYWKGSLECIGEGVPAEVRAAAEAVRDEAMRRIDNNI